MTKPSDPAPPGRTDRRGSGMGSSKPYRGPERRKGERRGADRRGTSLTVFLVDNDEAFRVSLASALQMLDYKVESYASAMDFLFAYDGLEPGCLILDYRLPGMNGLELQAHLNSAGNTLPIIFVTGHGGVPESVQAIKAGALDFLEKPFSQSVLIERVETALAMASERIASKAGTARLDAKFKRLTMREMEVVSHMAANPSQTSSKEVGARLGISPRTADHHRARILEKLQVRTVAELVTLAQRYLSKTSRSK
ncbi:response regulator [Gemmobacter sp. 24YEA27]|uniref:response regulator transcription factor n=1 Tax=Gemmobacter sp. 24YEA27 TaxID=3040672 RepID=UPI0024B366C0|nr:response regulator [Gemmobacter sp. 24YEA27]